MAKTARCPSCGAPVEFRSVASVLAVCDYCQSTLLRHGDEVENLGKMAALIEDRSPLQRGAEGRWRGLHFALVGRIQLRYEQGLWNEWHLLFNDGKSGWISEAGGEYVLSLPHAVSETPPAFADLKIGQRHVLAGRAFTVTNILQAECVAGEGELPFKVGGGYAAPVVDLRDAKGGFATLDYSEDAARPVVFLGESVKFKSLDWANLRAGMPIPEITVKAKAFNCPHCGSPLAIKHENIASLGCPGCGSVIDTAADTLKIIGRTHAALEKPRLPLGSTATLRGEKIEVIGYMERAMSSDGIVYCWGEYVCLGKDNALVWLTEYDGHWNIARVLNRSVRAADIVRLDKEAFKHFQGYHAHVKFVIGEFPWRVRIDEVATVDDYVAPPRMLSRESTDNEETWTVAEYAPPEEIAAAFGIKTFMAQPSGIFANQPNPHVAGHRTVCRRFWLFALAAGAIQIGLLVANPGGALLKQSLVFDAKDSEPVLTREFRLAATMPRLDVANATSINNGWLDLDMTLVNQDTGDTWRATREISHYEGFDDGESWSEGSRSDTVVFRDLPAGSYLIEIEPEMDAKSPPLRSELTVRRGGPRWSSLGLVLGFLALFPIGTRLRQRGFEIKRWAESDHPIVSQGGGDGGEGGDWGSDGGDGGGGGGDGGGGD